MASTLSNEQKDYLHALYMLLRTAPLTPQCRYRAFEAAACELPPLHVSGRASRLQSHLFEYAARGICHGRNVGFAESERKRSSNAHFP